MPDEEVIVECAKTDPEAFGRLYDMYYQPIFGFLLSRVGNAEVAKDLVSETFFQALKSIARYKYRGKPFKSWLFAIAVAQSGNYFRQRAKYLSVSLDECPEVMTADLYRPDVAMIEDEEATATQAQVRRLRRLMTQLNQRQQTIISLRYFSHMTVPEVAQVMTMKENTVKSHLHRALNKLQALMAEEEQNSDGTYRTYADEAEQFGAAV